MEAEQRYARAAKACEEYQKTWPSKATEKQIEKWLQRELKLIAKATELKAAIWPQLQVHQKAFYATDGVPNPPMRGRFKFNPRFGSPQHVLPAGPKKESAHSHFCKRRINRTSYPTAAPIPVVT